MQKLELLAPAQNYKCAISAINSGADAVYIGANAFGARNAAKNSLEDIEKIINYAHLFNVKVYVTLNTILDDNELLECQKIIQKLYEIKADAVIFQDFGILELSNKGLLPPIVLHASTQCDNRNAEKVKFFEDIGIKRVILARELSIEKIENIRKNTSLELEHFIHGALCVSYSGNCYMSEYIGSRSANRGCCAQACRKKYSLINKKGEYIKKNLHLLSLKDNNLSKHLDKLIRAGITSFKIEGRLKDENYIKNIVLYYHNLLKNYPRTSFGYISADFSPNPYKSFNRGFCDDYLFNKKDNIYNFLTPKSTGEYLGVVKSTSDSSFILDTKEQINPQDGLCFEYRGEFFGCLVNKAQVVKGGVKIYPNKKLNLKAGDKIFRNIDTNFNKTLENSKTTRKTDIELTISDNSIIAINENSIKAQVLFEFSEVAKDKEKMKQNYIKALSKTTDTPYNIKKINFKTQELAFLPVSKINELRRNLLDELSKNILSRYKTKKQKPVNTVKFPLDEGDYRLNVHNSKALDFYEKCGCEVRERSFESIKERSGKEIIGKELMRTKHCLKRACLNCKNQDELFLVDEKGVKFPLEFDCKNCEMIILSP